jgi:hypothetical protein
MSKSDALMTKTSVRSATPANISAFQLVRNRNMGPFLDSLKFLQSVAATATIPRGNTETSYEMSEETWPERYAKLDQSFDRREWRKQYEQQWPIECDHARQTGEVGLRDAGRSSLLRGPMRERCHSTRSRCCARGWASREQS